MLNQSIKRLAANTIEKGSPSLNNYSGKKVILDRPVPSSQSESFPVKKKSIEVFKPQVFKLTEIDSTPLEVGA